jgi:hypothetical protein
VPNNISPSWSSRKPFIIFKNPGENRREAYGLTKLPLCGAQKRPGLYFKNLGKQSLGRVMTRIGRVMIKLGRVMMKLGRVVTELGRVMTKLGRVMRNLGRIMTGQLGWVMTEFGRVMT